MQLISWGWWMVCFCTVQFHHLHARRQEQRFFTLYFCLLFMVAPTVHLCSPKNEKYATYWCQKTTPVHIRWRWPTVSLSPEQRAGLSPPFIQNRFFWVHLQVGFSVFLSQQLHLVVSYSKFSDKCCGSQADPHSCKSLSPSFETTSLLHQLPSQMRWRTT